VVAVLEIKWGE